jgi:hypothetical protein
MITVIISSAGGVTSLLAALLGLWNNRKIVSVHALVNRQHDDLVDRADQLTGALNDAGVDVPRNPPRLS